MRAEDNPLLHYRFDIPFDGVRPEHVDHAIDSLLARSRARVDAIKQPVTEPSYAGTLGALDVATEELEHAMAVVGHLEAVQSSPELREAYNRVQPKVTEFYAGLSLDKDLYRAIREFARSAEAKALDPARARFLKTTLDDFKRHGAELGEPEKQRLSQISVELSKLTTQFSQNVLDATMAFDLVLSDDSRLSGLPESAREAARESAKSKGLEGYRFTLQQPSYVAVMTYADDAALREAVYRAYNARATSGPLDNRGLIVDILRLRKEKAKLLGFVHFADLTLEDRMAKTGEKAREFIGRLRVETEAQFIRENADLATFRRELEGPNAPDVAPWDVGYYSEKLRHARYDFDEELLRPYFEVDAVLSGMFALVNRIYGIRVVQKHGMPRYHPDVRYYSVEDQHGGEIGAFYADLYPREEKRGGAWMGDFITGVVDGQHTRHLGVMCLNASPPVGDKPALLTHADVETLLHEFGHLLHHLLAKPAVRSLAGTRVAWDFVELPSMIMENFGWERSVLDFLARHYKTSEHIPEALLDRLMRTRTFRAANVQMRQLGFAEVDLALHMQYDPDRDGDVLAFARHVAQAHAASELPEDYAMIAGFGHLFSSPVGYAAGYYSYKWAEVLEADAFSRFKENGVLSAEVGEEFRARVLARGNEADPMELFVSFMGREPSVDALLVRAGLKAA